MEWVISHQSALELWRSTNVKKSLAGKKLRAMKLPTGSLSANEMLVENPHNLSMPLHILVGSDNARKKWQSLHCHISSCRFQHGSFIEMSSGLVVSSPELCFVQMANEISLVDLVKLGFEFCGTYRLEKSDRGFREDLSLSSVSKLSSYVTKAVGLKGRTNAIKALHLIADRSASPMETILTMLLTLPYRLGGYGFPKPQLNYPIDVSYKVRNSEGKSTFYCDLYWPDKKVAVEYDSDAYHAGPDKIGKDSIRRNALISTGVTMITVSRIQITDISRLRELSEVLSKLLGKRLKYELKDFTFRQPDLLDQLLWTDKIDNWKHNRP